MFCSVHRYWNVNEILWQVSYLYKSWNSADHIGLPRNGVDDVVARTVALYGPIASE